MKYLTFGAVAALSFASQAQALCTSYTVLNNGTTADATTVNNNFNCAALTSGSTINGLTLTGATTFPGSTTISSTGQLGVGTSAAITAMLQAEKDSASSDASVRIVNATDGTASTARLDFAGGSSGSLSELTIAQYAPSFTGTGFGLTLGGYSIVLENTDSSHGSGLILGTSAAHPVIFGVGNAEIGRFGSNGSFLVGTTANGGWNGTFKAEIRSSVHGLSVYSTGSTGGVALLSRVDNTANWLGGFYYGSTNVGGITTNGTSTAFNTTSDERLKNWAIPQRNYATAIRSLWVGDFTWKANGHTDFGIRAQQAYPLFPSAIHKPDAAAGQWQADYSKLAPLALWGVKDLYRSSDSQSTRISALEYEISALHQVNDADQAEIRQLKAQISVATVRLQTQVSELQRRAGVRTASN